MFLRKLAKRGGIADQPGLEWIPGAGGVNVPTPDTPFLVAKQVVDRAVGAVWTLVDVATAAAIFFAVTTAGAGYGWYKQAQRSDLKVIQQTIDANGELGELKFAEPLKFTTAIFDQVLRRFIPSCFSKFGGDNNATAVHREYCGIVASGGAAVEKINERVLGVINNEFSNFVQIRRITPDPNQSGWFNVVWDEETARSDGKPGQCRRSSGNFKLEQVEHTRMADFIKRPTFVFVTSAQFGYESQVEGRCNWE